jgi:hypothetical protein
MTSVIYYKLKSAIQQHHINFDGSVIQIGDVKRLVAQKQGLGPDGALELTLFDSNTGEEYADDNKVIPRNTLVLVKRTPGIKLKPLIAGEQSVTVQRAGPVVGAAAAASKAADQKPLFSHALQSSQPQHPPSTKDFGDDLYASAGADDTMGIVGEDESRALHTLLQGTAATWQREVRQGALRGRGRGRGRGAGLPPDYRCPRCEAVGAHWLQDCPTHGDPTYDRKRVRPPVGIPMTRLARSNEGGLVLPDGQMGTLVANEDAFAREVLGLGLIPNQAGAQQEQGQAVSPLNSQSQKEETLALEYPNPESASHTAPTAAPTAAAGAAPTFQPLLKASSMSIPKLAGEAFLRNDGLFHKDTPDASFFDFYIKAAFLPRGPPEFLRKAYGGQEPLPRSEFERLQEEHRLRLNLPTRVHKPRERPGGAITEGDYKSRPRDRSDWPSARSPRRRSRSRDRSPHKDGRSQSRDRRRDDIGRHSKPSKEAEMANSLEKSVTEGNAAAEQHLGTKPKEDDVSDIRLDHCLFNFVLFHIHCGIFLLFGICLTRIWQMSLRNRLIIC